MVMYTKKYPRLSDGYNDRHSYEKDSRYPANRPEKRDYDKSPSHYSSPRYVHKSSHGDRNKDKYDRADHIADSGVDRKLAGKTHKPGKQVDADAIDTSNSCRTDSSELKFEKRDGTDTGSDDQDHKDEVLKTAVKVCGSWSEHISSSGKRYYYNCETEVSQWEKPRDWRADTPKSTDGRRLEEEHKLEGKDEKPRHYLHNGGSIEKATGSPCDASQYNGDSQEATVSHLTTSVNRSGRKSDLVSVEKTSSSEAAVIGLAKTKYSTALSVTVADKGGTLVEQKCRPLPVELGSPIVAASSEQRARDNHQGEDMEISPESSPKRLQPTVCPQDPTNTRNGHRKVPVSLANTCSSSPAFDATQLVKQLGDKPFQAIDRNAMIGQALQTLQKIHEAILSRQGLAATQQSPRLTCPESPFLPSKSPQITHMWQTPMTPLVVPDESSRPSIESPRSDSGGGNRLQRKEAAAAAVSPALSASGNNVPLASALAQAVSKLPPHVMQQLPAHLSNHYDEQLLVHVAGWQADHAEKQARRYGDEAHTLGSLHCTKVSVDLKKARSLVRVAEIRSTLQEHRFLFLQHRRLELENADKHFSTQ